VARAKEAALELATLLGDKDRVGVIAFNHQYEWLIHDLGKKQWEQLQSALAPIAAAGGTELGPPLESALDLLAKTPPKPPTNKRCAATSSP